MSRDSILSGTTNHPTRNPRTNSLRAEIDRPSFAQGLDRAGALQKTGSEAQDQPLPRAGHGVPGTGSTTSTSVSHDHTASNNKAIQTSTIRDVDASVTAIPPAAQSSTTCPISDHDRSDATVTVSRRKNPEAFESAARLKKSINPKYYKTKKTLGPSIYSAEELVLIHKAAQAQIEDMKNTEIKHRGSFVELQKENATLQGQIRDLDKALNKRIAHEDKIVNERCKSREETSDGILIDSASDISTLRQEVIGLKARGDAAFRSALREIEILQQQRDDARQKLKDARKDMQAMQKQSKAQSAVKLRPESDSGSSAADIDSESVSDENTTPRPRIPPPTRATRNLLSSDIVYAMDEPVFDETDFDDDPDSEAYAIPSSSPYKPTSTRKRKRGASAPKEDFGAHDEIEQRDKEAIREAIGLRRRTSKRTQIL